MARPRLTLALCCLAAAAGCNAFRHTADPVSASAATAAKAPEVAAAAPPGQFHLRLSQYVFYSNFPLKADNPLLHELGELREQVYRELQLPSADTIVQVFLFEDREKYERFMRGRYPDLPRRRAFFVAQPRHVGGTDELFVYTFYGEHIRQDLRHELTHALLHSVLRDVPLWLDEGLAEYFELPPENAGVNAAHLETLRHSAVTPDLVRLEHLKDVDQMKPPEYREAWAWVHLMLRGHPDARHTLLTYLQQLRVTPNAGQLQPRLQQLYPSLGSAFDQHLATLDLMTLKNRVRAAAAP